MERRPELDWLLYINVRRWGGLSKRKSMTGYISKIYISLILYMVAIYKCAALGWGGGGYLKGNTLTGYISKI